MCRSPWLPPREGGAGGRHFGVIRHAERGDGAFATVDGIRWTQTDDFARWPLDPPLSDEGQASAQKLASHVLDFYNELSSRVDVVVTSPYLRCAQTAAVICEKLGPRVCMVVDNSLGEIYGPSVMGSMEPAQAVRPFEEVPDLRLAQKLAGCKVVGNWPVWPEDVRGARRRFAGRFLWWVRWACKAQRNFLLVTHADSIGAALRVMPSHAEQVLESVDFGGMFLASLSPESFHFSLQEQTPKEKRLEENSSEEMRAEEPSPKERRLSEADGSSRRTGKASRAWCVRTDGLKLHQTGVPAKVALAKRLGILATEYSPARELVELLGGRSGALHVEACKTSPSTVDEDAQAEEEASLQEAPAAEGSFVVIEDSTPAPKQMVLSEVGRSLLLQRRRRGLA